MKINLFLKGRKVSIVEFRYCSFETAGPFEGGIMMHHELFILGLHNIKFEHIACLFSEFEALHSVFRSLLRTASMTNAVNFLAFAYVVKRLVGPLVLLPKNVGEEQKY